MKELPEIYYCPRCGDIVERHDLKGSVQYICCGEECRYWQIELKKTKNEDPRPKLLHKGEAMLKKFMRILHNISIFLGFLGTVCVPFLYWVLNPELSQMQLIFAVWKIWLGSIILLVAGLCLDKWNRLRRKHTNRRVS